MFSIKIYNHEIWKRTETDSPRNISKLNNVNHEPRYHTN